MAQGAVISAVEGKLGEPLPGVLTDMPVVGVLTPNNRPAGAAAFLLVQYPVTNAQQITIGAPGDNVWRDEGVFTVTVHQPKAKFAMALQQADAIASLFRGQYFGGVQCWAPQSARFDDENDKGLYTVASVAVPYWFDYRG